MAKSRLSIARIATHTPMGAQAYEQQVISRAADALGAGWSVTELVFRSMRSSLPGNRRLPMGKVATAPAAMRRALGRALFRGDAVSHRTALELPPGPVDVVTLHDVVAWRFPDESAPVAAAAAELQRAAAVICVSEFSAQEAVDLLGVRNPIVVPNGVDLRYFDARPLTSAEREKLGLHGPYVLHAGGAALRKNLDSLATAWRTVHQHRPHLTLALAGPAHPRRSALFEGLPGTRLLGRLPDEQMPALVAGAAAVVVPSLYEGFGLPVLEAMAANVPVVAANTSSLPEVAAGHAIIVEPDPRSIAEGIIEVTSDDVRRAQLIRDARAHAGAFTWDRSAAGHARVWSSVS